MQRSGLIRALTFCAVAQTATAQPVSLALLIDCTPGETCYIQNYVDHDATDLAADFTCNTLTYDGHKGTDFGLVSLAEMQRGVAVLAAASGTVVALRDGMPDTGLTPETADTIKDRDCGNAVLIRHAGGWETQYCHMKNGSVAVQKGQQVEQGATLGQVGLSGRTQFPHVHLSLRQNRTVVDPFDPAGTATCGAPAPKSLWQTPLAYQAGGLLSVGFATAIPTFEHIKAGTAALSEIAPDAPALVLWGYAFGGRRGDTMRIDITGPEGWSYHQRIPLNKTQAQLFRASGKKRNLPEWPAGTYSGTVTLLRGSEVLSTLNTSATIP